MGRGPICLRQRNKEALANQETRHLLWKWELVLSRAAVEHSLKSNLTLFPQHRASREDRALHVHRVWPQAFSCCPVSLVPHLLITDNEVNVHTNGYICTRAQEHTRKCTLSSLQLALMGARALLLDAGGMDEFLA